VKFGAVIAAAGLSSRMEAFKPLLPLGNSTFIERIIGALEEGGAEDIAVVTGRDADLIEKALEGYKPSFLHNRDYAVTDMFHSAAMGLEFMAERVEGIFFTTADIPLFSAATVRLLAERIRRDNKHIVIPSYQGKNGHPIVMLSRAAKELIRCTKPGGLRGAIDAYDGPKETLALDDRGILYDADTPEDYRRVLSIYRSL
jgi:CTP:molybdopterin cytidylyltransferase MocA